MARRRTLNAQINATLAQAEADPRPCTFASNPEVWDVNVRDRTGRRLCVGCPISELCGDLAIIDEALALLDCGLGLKNAVVSGTRGGMSARFRRPLVTALYEGLVDDDVAAGSWLDVLVPSTRGGLNGHAGRPTIRERSAAIVAERKARTEADRKHAEAQAETAGAAA